MQIFNHLNANFAKHFGPREEPLPWTDDEQEDGFYDDVMPRDLPLPVSFPLGDDAE